MSQRKRAFTLMLSYKKASRRTSCWIKFASCSLPPTKPPDPLAARNKLFDSLPHSAVSKPRRRKTCVPLLEFFGNPTHTCHTHRANVQSRETTTPRHQHIFDAGGHAEKATCQHSEEGAFKEWLIAAPRERTGCRCHPRRNGLARGPAGAGNRTVNRCAYRCTSVE